jgi:hypothetical protein
MSNSRTIAAMLACFGIAAPLVAQDAAKSRAFVDKYCVACHNQKTAFPADGQVRLDPAGFDDLTGHAETWERVLRKLSVRAMPPPGVPRL